MCKQHKKTCMYIYIYTYIHVSVTADSNAVEDFLIQVVDQFHAAQTPQTQWVSLSGVRSYSSSSHSGWNMVVWEEFTWSSSWTRNAACHLSGKSASYGMACRHSDSNRHLPGLVLCLGQNWSYWSSWSLSACFPASPMGSMHSMCMVYFILLKALAKGMPWCWYSTCQATSAMHIWVQMTHWVHPHWDVLWHWIFGSQTHFHIDQGRVVRGWHLSVGASVDESLIKSKSDGMYVVHPIKFFLETG